MATDNWHRTNIAVSDVYAFGSQLCLTGQRGRRVHVAHGPQSIQQEGTQVCSSQPRYIMSISVFEQWESVQFSVIYI